MYSREWKLAAVCALALSLTACPHAKKKQKDGVNQFTGLWVNSEAYERLNGITIGLDSNRVQPLCYAVNNHASKFGIVRTFEGELMLDAWYIHGNGDVYRFSAANNSQGHGFRSQRYYAGRISGTSFNRDTRSGTGLYTSYTNSTPFASGNAILTIESDKLWITGAYSYGRRSSVTSYTRIKNYEELNRITMLLQLCNDMLDLGDGWNRNGAYGPGPNQNPGPGPGPGPGGPGGPGGQPQIGPSQPGGQPPGPTQAPNGQPPL